MSFPMRENLYTRTVAFIQMAVIRPDVAAAAKKVSVSLIGYFVRIMEFESWYSFRAALGYNGLQEVSTRVMEWRKSALYEEDEAAAWGYEIIAINLSATAAIGLNGDTNSSAAAYLTDSILRKAITEVASS